MISQRKETFEPVSTRNKKNVISIFNYTQK